MMKTMLGRPTAVLGRGVAADLLLVLAMAVASPLVAQDTAKVKEKKPYSPPPIFMDSKPIEFTLVGPFGKIKKQRTGEATYFPGTVSYAGDAGAVSVPVRLRARGIWRRKNCEIPPVLMNFSKDSTKKTVFAKLDRARLTFPCRLNADYEQYVLQEYELYRVQRVLTPYSFDVRLARVTFIDSQKNDTIGTFWSFLSEQDSVFAERNGATLTTQQGATPGDLETYESAFFGVFQYFVANADYSIAALHNVVLVMKNNQYIPVARDYDFGGAVNARYATPPEILRIRRVRDRIMRGYCAPAEEYAKVFALFRDKKAEIYALYSDPLAAAVTPTVVKETLKYFDEFYAVINDPKKAQREIVEACIGAGG
jgi:hypothetical protein